MPRDAFLFYVDDWLSSGRIELMDAHEERGYLRLLLRAWKDPDCSLPNDDVVLASWSKMGSQWFKDTCDKSLRVAGLTSGVKVKACFREASGRLINDRQRKEWEYQRAVNVKRSASGKLGGRPRKEIPNENQTVTGSLPDGLANDKQTETNRNQKPKPSANAEEKKASPKKPGSAHSSCGTRFSEEVMPDAWLEFAVHEEGWTAEQAVREFQIFADWWKSKPGKDALKTNWLATWRVWLRKDGPRNPRGLQPAGPLFAGRGNSVDRMMRAAGEEMVEKRGRA